MPLSSGEPSRPATGEPADETVSQNKKHALSCDGQETSTAKRAKVVNDAAPSPKKPKASQKSAKARITTAKRKGVDPGPGEIRWSVVPCSDSPRTVSSENLERANVWPRLWSSNREELLSAFPEISGSRCVNSISWVATDMPILILEDEFVTLEKPVTVDNELCMDVVFAREFAVLASYSLPGVEIITAPNVYEPATNMSNDVRRTQPLTPVNDPVTTTESLGQKTNDTVPPSVEVLAPSDHPSVEKASPPNGSTSSCSAPLPRLTIPIPRRKQEKIGSEMVMPRPKDKPTTLTAGSQTTKVERKTGKTSSVLSSLRFKKILPVAPDAPTSTNTTTHADPPPHVPPAMDSHFPELHPLDTRTPTQRDVPANANNFEPAFTHYPDSRFLHKAYNFLEELPGNFVAPLATSHPQCLAAPSVPGTGWDQIGSFGIDCRCSEVGYNRRCRLCGEEAEAPGAPPSSANLIVAPSAQMSQLSLATFPNNQPLGRQKGSWHLYAAARPSGPWEPRENRPQRIVEAPLRHSPTTSTSPIEANPPSAPRAMRAVARLSTQGDSHENMPRSASAVRPPPCAIDNQQPAAGSSRIVGGVSALIPLSGPGVVGILGTSLGGAVQRNETMESSAPSLAPLHTGPSQPMVGVEPAVSSPAPGAVNDNPGESCADPNPPLLLKRKGKEKEKALVDEQSSSSTQRKAEPKRRGRPPKKLKGLSGTQVQASVLEPPSSSTSHVKIEDYSAVQHLDHTSLEGGGPTLGVLGPDLRAVGESTPSSSVAALPKKRGRVPLSAESRSQPSGSIIPIKSDPLESSQSQLHSPQSPKPGPIPKPKPKPHSGEVRMEENGVPSPIPDELKALVDAYINGLPVGVFAARKHLRGFWGLRLAQEKEIGYVFMGFYRISRVWETLKGLDGKQQVTVENGVTRGHVRWRFRMKWEPGGEDMQVCQQEKLLSPWWKPFARVEGLVTLPRLDLEDSDDESTVVYRMARRKNPGLSRRHCSFNQIFFSVLPLHLLAPVDAAMPDSMFPYGWYCGDCGKLNFRYYLRHRRCGSSFCKNKPAAEGYAEDIDTLRDPQDVLPLTVPMNEYPSGTSATVQNWSNRMKTVIYRPDAGRSVVLQHIFTCNLKDLQKEASDLLNEIQMHVPLRRLTGDTSTNPFFMYFAGEGQEGVFVPWVDVPECLVRTKALMNERGRKYGRKSATELEIKQLKVRAWVNSGNKRGTDPLRAKERCIVIMCLGCEVIMSISPKSVSNDNLARIPDYEKMIPMEDFPESKSEAMTQTGGETMEELSKDINAQALTAPAVVAETGVVDRSQKETRITVSVSLVHGDILLLEGDEFEYSLKRSGTSILLFGT